MPLRAGFDGPWLYREEQNRHPEIAHKSTKGGIFSKKHLVLLQAVKVGGGMILKSSGERN